MRQRHKTRRAETDGERGENRSFDSPKKSKVFGCQRKQKMTHFSQPDTGSWSRGERWLGLYRKWLPHKMSLKRGQPKHPHPPQKKSSPAAADKVTCHNIMDGPIPNAGRIGLKTEPGRSV